MKKLTTLFLILTISNFSYSQKLKFQDLKFIYEHDIETVDNYLLNKGFDFYKREKDESQDIRYSNQYISKNRTFIVKNGDDSNEGFSWYQFYDRSIYLSIKEECKKNGYRLLSTEPIPLNESSLNYTYTNGKRKIQFNSSFEQNTTKYFITFGRVYSHEL